MICSCCSPETAEPPPDYMTATWFLREVCRRRGLAVIRVMCHDRSRTASKLRREIAAELRLAGYSLPEIGKAMRRHHTTILHALKHTG